MYKNLTKIGSGLFTDCYRLNDEEVLLVTDDYVKECMSLGWFPDSRYYPKIELIGEQDYSDTSRVYKTKGYNKLPRSWRKTLCKEDADFYSELKKIYRDKDVSSLDKCREAFKTIKDERKKEMLMETVQALSNYGSDCCFEISERNVMIDGDKLILNDCFFIQSQAIEKKREKNRR